MSGFKAKTIRKVINAKLKNWLDSIQDEDLKHSIKRDAVVTGGAIASMLLGEKVNDFDIYFKTKETTKKVAEYYVKKFGETNYDYDTVVKEENIENCKGAVEPRITIFIKSIGVLDSQEEGIITEESIEDQIINDILEVPQITSVKEKYRPVFITQNAITLSEKIQLIIRFFGEPSQIHNNFDFAHCMCYYEYSNDKLTLPAEALECLLSKTLVYKGSLYPIASIFRAKKFIERGWKVNAGQLLKIMWQINELDLRNFSQLREQLTGVDLTYMLVLIRALEDIDKDKISSTYVSEIIDRIF